MSYLTKHNVAEIRRHIHCRGKKRVLFLDMEISGYRIRRSLKTTDKTVAIQRAIKLLMELEERKKTSRVTLSTLKFQFGKLKKKLLSETYIRDTQSSIDRFIEVNGDLDLSNVGTRQVELFKSAMAVRVKCRKGDENVYISGYAINGYCRMLRSAFNFAIKMQWVSINPFSKFGKVRELVKLPHSYTAKEMRLLLAKATELKGRDFALMLELYLLTGLRREEGSVLQFSYCDFDALTMNIPANLTKTGRERIIPLSRRAIEILIELRSRHQRPIPLGPDTITEYFNDVKAETNFKGKFHDIRKTCATWLSASGLSPFFVAMVLGHKFPGVTFSNYIDYPIEEARGALESLTEKLSSGTEKESLQLVEVKNL